MDNLNIPQNVLFILNKLNLCGHKAFVVGGCVRNSLLKKPIKDWDITTSALVEEIQQIFTPHYNVGLKHGTIVIQLDGEFYEITTFRKDGMYLDGRHPSTVTFTNSLIEDLSRRDFTVNAIAYHPDTGYIDPFNGIQHIEEGLLRPVGRAEDRFKEDPLRMMRAFRFISQYNFSMELETEKVVQKNAFRIVAVSKERVQDEFNKILLGEYVHQALIFMQECGLLKLIIPELYDCVGFNQNNLNHDKTVFNHLVAAVSYSKPILEVRLAALLHDIAKPLVYTEDNNGGHFYDHDTISAQMTEIILTRMKYPKKIVQKVQMLVRFHMIRFEKRQPKNLRKFIYTFGKENLEDLYSVMRADAMASTNRSTELVEILKAQIDSISTEEIPMSLKDLNINGHILSEIGVPQNPIMGEILKKLLNMVLDGEVANITIILVNKAKELLSQYKEQS